MPSTTADLQHLRSKAAHYCAAQEVCAQAVRQKLRQWGATADDADSVVGVHDGVRPFVSVEVIRRCFEQARSAKAVIPVIPVVETLRHVQGSLSDVQGSHTVPRDEYCLVQTPQCFDIQLLKAANRQPYRDAFTDDASVVEAFGHPVTLVEGNRENIKITTPADLHMAESLLL